MSVLVRRVYRADGSEFIELRRRGTQELVAKSESGRWLIATDATKEERAEIDA